MSLGPIMLDLRGAALEQDERELLLHPLVGGVILFSRNFTGVPQLRSLCDAIHSLRNPPLLIAVDHEGGRVQRFHGEFTDLPPCAAFGRVYAEDPQMAQALAEQAGWLMAAELLAAGVDLSFAPVLDLDTGVSQVIGDRAFHRHPDTVAILARRFMQGMHTAGMAAVGKHFPGHGSVREDSHHVVPRDPRGLEDIAMQDLVPFERLIDAGLPGIMPAHVIYPMVDARPAGYSRRWIDEVLRTRLRFKGTVFSDDISMAAAEVAGDYPERAALALAAGCDMVVACNNQTAAIQVLKNLDYIPHPLLQARLMRMHGQGPGLALADLRREARWQSAAARLAALNRTPELGLGDDTILS